MLYPWISLYKWEPFRVDALGLITLLGAEEINTWVGRLVRSRWMEYMPLLAMPVISGDRFRAKSPSFSLYNISAGIFTTECAAWFTRWIQCQNFEKNRVIVFWETAEMPQRRRLLENLTAIFVSFCFTGLLLATSVLSRDFYGTANACAIIVSVLTRAYNLYANRAAIDSNVSNLGPLEGNEKLIVITPDAKVTTMFIPNKLIIPVFVRDPTPQSYFLYKASRWISWIAFGIHVTTLGMASLANQIYTIALILASSILVWHGFGCADMVQPIAVNFEGGGYSRAYTCWIGSYLKATIFKWPTYLEFEQTPEASWRLRDVSADSQPDALPRPTRRMDLYAWLNLTDEEETSFSKWDLLPHQRHQRHERHGDTSWERAFSAKRKLIRDHCPDILQIKSCVDLCLEGSTSKVQQQKDDVESCVSDNDRGVNPLVLGCSQNVTSVPSIPNRGVERDVWSQSAPPEQIS